RPEHVKPGQLRIPVAFRKTLRSKARPCFYAHHSHSILACDPADGFALLAAPYVNRHTWRPQVLVKRGLDSLHVVAWRNRDTEGLLLVGSVLHRSGQLAPATSTAWQLRGGHGDDCGLKRHIAGLSSLHGFPPITGSLVKLMPDRFCRRGGPSPSFRRWRDSLRM